MSGSKRSVRSLLRSPAAPLVVIVLALFAWSLHAYLTVWVDADVIAEAIAVQRWLSDPGLVLTYPGQRYGGVLEYPLVALAELIAPGSPYGFTLIRVLYLPFVGFAMAQSLRLLFPSVSLWPFAAAAAIGPAVLHGMMAIKDLYPLSWVLGSAGAWLVTRSVVRGHASRSGAIVGGLLVGLAAYEHPTSLLLTVPFLAAVLLVRPGALRSVAWSAVGVLPGLALLVIAAVTADPDSIVYDPASATGSNIWTAFGLSLEPNAWARAMVPNGWGVQSTDLNYYLFALLPQFVINVVLFLGLLVAVAVVLRSIVRRRRGHALGERAFLGAVWTTVLIEVIVLASVIPANFFYGAALAPLVWLTLELLPAALPQRSGWVAVGLVLALMFVTTLGTFLALQPKLKDAVWFKQQRVNQVAAVADELTAAGITIVVGDYWETLPIMHASDGGVHAVTPGTDRFPLPSSVASVEQIVAVPDGRLALPIGLGAWPGAAPVRALVESRCDSVMSPAGLPAGFTTFRCVPTALAAGS